MSRGRESCSANQDQCPDNNGPDSCRPSLKEDLCKRMKQANASSKVLENVLDIASTLVNIMQICCINECKANRALDVIIYAFMHFDEVADHPGGKCKKRIRKEEFYNDLTRDCGMNKAETKLTYAIVKCAFKAFYHKQGLNDYDTSFVDECEWRSAANKTITAFAQCGVSKSEIELTGRRILCAYENYICRLQAKSCKNAENANKGVCSPCRPSVPQPCSPCKPCDPCKPRYPQPCRPPDPPLCGQLQCEFVCPPGSTCPQIICKDPCGRLFLKVDGEMICFDPLLMENEARRAAMELCPPSNADRIKALRESLRPCLPRDTDSCDEKLADICNEEEEGDEEECAWDNKKDGECGGGGEYDDEEQDEEGDGDEDKHESEDDDSDLAKNGFFISAGFSALENGKRKLDVRVRGACRKIKKCINVLNKLHVEGNHQEEMLYDLTPIIRTDEVLPISVKSLQISEGGKPGNEDTGEPAIEDTGEPVNEAAGKPAIEDTGEPVNEEVAEPVIEDAGEPANEAAAEPANEDAPEPVNEDAAEPANDAAEPAAQDAGE